MAELEGKIYDGSLATRLGEAAAPAGGLRRARRKTTAMAEIRPSEISDILRNEIKGFEGIDHGARNRPRALMRRRYRAHLRPAERGAGRAARISARDLRHGAQPRRRQRRRGAVRRSAGDSRRRRGQAHRPHRGSPGRRSAARTRRQCARPADRRQGADQDHRDATNRNQGARHHPPSAGQGAAADRNQGDRLDAADRARTARADHRRPPDRQDRDRDRHDHQSARPERAVLLRRDRAEALDRRAGGREAQPLRRDGIHHGGRRDRFRSGAAAVHRAVQRLHDGRVLPRQRHATRCWFTTIFPSTRRPIASCRCCCAVRRAARLIRATSSICIRACSSARPR